MPPTIGAAEGPAGLAEPGDGLGQLPGDVGLLGVAEVEVVGRPQRLGADAGEVGGALEHGRDRAAARVGGDPAAVAVDATARALPSSSARTAASACSGRRTVRDWTIGSYCSNSGRREARLGLASSASSVSRGLVPAAQGRLRAAGRSACRAWPARGHRAGSRRPAPGRACRRAARPPLRTRIRPLSVTVPIAAPPTSHFSQTASTASTSSGVDDAEHPLLGLRDHHLEGLHVGLAQRHRGDVDVQADLALGGHLRGRGGEAGRAEVLQRDEQTLLEQLERALEQLLLLERVADLDGRAHLGVAAELGRGEHRGATDPVAAGGGTEEDDDVPRSGGRAADEPVDRHEPEGHRVDEAVLLVGSLEVDLAADRRDADRVAVVADPRDGSLEQVAGPGRRVRGGADLAEAQRVEHGDRPGADREDVAQDPADAGGRALEGLDGARMVVGLDLEGAGQAAADGDGAGVLARAHDDVLALGGQRPQELLGVLVGAVLAPQQRVHGQLHLVGRAALLLADELVLRARQPEGQGVLDASAASPSQAWTPSTVIRIDSKIFRPSAEPPVSSSTACSGWGIRPKTLPALVADAGDVVDRAVEVLPLGVAQDQLPGVVHRRKRRGVGVVAPPGVLDGDREPFADRAGPG